MSHSDPVTRILEYSIREVGNEANVSEPQKEAPRKLLTVSSLVPGLDVYNDLVDLYNNVLLDYRGSHLVELATQAILESKHFAKEWPFVDAEDQYLRFLCRLVPRLCGTEAEMEMVLPVGEIVVVPMHATVGELKQAVENALKDTYCITDEFVLMEISELGIGG